jgi:hypothetical protein
MVVLRDQVRFNNVAEIKPGTANAPYVPAGKYADCTNLL